jgi:hypothetical protein
MALKSGRFFLLDIFNRITIISEYDILCFPAPVNRAFGGLESPPFFFGPGRTRRPAKGHPLFPRFLSGGRAAWKIRNISRDGANSAKEDNDSDLGSLGALARANPNFERLPVAEKFTQAQKTGGPHLAT